MRNLLILTVIVKTDTGLLQPAFAAAVDNAIANVTQLLSTMMQIYWRWQAIQPGGSKGL